MNYETCSEIEIAVARHFNPRKNMIVPNVWWGLDLNHECDLFVLTRAGYTYEVEIKVSRADLKADARKRHNHASKKIKRLYFAIPEKLEPCIDLIPGRAGVLVLRPNGAVKKLREAESNPGARKLNEKESLHLGQLCSMRIWTLKSALLRLAAMKNIPLQETLDL